MLQHFMFKAQSPGAVASVHSLLQVSCDSTIQGLWLQCQLQPGASTLVSRALAFPPWLYAESHNTHTNFQFCACYANRNRESINNKNNPSWPQSTVWDWRLCQARTKQWITLSQSPMGNLANLPSIMLDDRSTGQLCRAAVHPFSPMMTLAPSAFPFSLLTTAICVPRCMRQGILQRALVRLSQPRVIIRWCSNVTQVTFILDFLGFEALDSTAITNISSAFCVQYAARVDVVLRNLV